MSLFQFSQLLEIDVKKFLNTEITLIETQGILSHFY